MRNSRIKQKMNADEPALVTLMHLTDPTVFEMASLMGFDGIWMDQEHHPYSLETAAGLMRAARVGSADIVVRPAKLEFAQAARLLEAGAQGIMYPRCTSAEEAAELVQWTRFAPLGSRGFDGANADMPYLSLEIDDYVKQANEKTFLIVQIEDPQGVRAAPAIAAVEGIDALMFGSGDFTVLSGIPGQFDHPLVEEARAAIAEAALDAGKHWGMPVGDAAEAELLISMGARFISYQADIAIIKQGFERIQTDFAPLGFRFENRLSESDTVIPSIP